MKYLDDLKELFEETFAEKLSKTENVRADGSNRAIIRLISLERSVIGVWGPDKKENRAFVEFSKHFKSADLNVPEIYAYDEKKQIYLETDLGNQTLFDFLVRKRDSSGFDEELKNYYKKALKHLSLFQTKGLNKFDLNWCYPRKEFDEQSMMWDLNYFKYYFLKLGGIAFDEDKLEDDYKKFVEFIKDANRNFFLYRDFQSRNIMVKDNDLFFIDYQGGRRGFLAYDVAALLYDAKADIPHNIRLELLDYYLGLPEIKKVITREEFLKYYYMFVYIRIMQAMGAYGLRGFYERKPHFLTSVPYVIKNIEWLLANVELPVKMPELLKVFKRITTSTYLRQFSDKNKRLGLNLRIYSFSYRKGFPPDPEGHNGGFVFDTRCLINPGRIPELSHITGRDDKIKEFLDSDADVKRYYHNCRLIIEQAVENYLKRNFTELYVAFGCTGGQHRSVYMAEKLFNDFSKKENVTCHLNHTVLGINK
ncbi:MAG: phosphotransferase [Elusimicrobiales bacterium]|nr:phosphotransferase [Elusimicrobiales bacterium]